MIELNSTFKWNDQVIKEHKITIDDEFLRLNNIKKNIGASGLILIYQHYYNIDISDYGLMDIIISESVPKITLFLKESDFREIYLNDILNK
jgi:hypothetical protein